MSRGVRVWGKLVEHDVLAMWLDPEDGDNRGIHEPLGDDDVKELLDALVNGRFTRVKVISLVICAVVVCC